MTENLIEVGHDAAQNTLEAVKRREVEGIGAPSVNDIQKLLAGIFDTARKQLAVSKDIAAHLRDINRNTALDTALIMKNVDAHIGQSFLNQARGRAPRTLDDVKQRIDEHLDGLPATEAARPQATLVTLTPGNIRALKERFDATEECGNAYFKFKSEDEQVIHLYPGAVLVREASGTVTWHASESIASQVPDLVWLEREIPEPTQPAATGHKLGGENRGFNGATTIIVPAEDKPAEPEFIVWQFDGSADSADRIYHGVRKTHRGYVSWGQSGRGDAYLAVRPSDAEGEREEVEKGHYVVVQPAAKELIVRDAIGLSSMIRRIGRSRFRFMACAEPTAPAAEASEKAAPVIEPGDVTDEVEAVAEAMWRTLNRTEPHKMGGYWSRYTAAAAEAMNHIARTQMDDAIKAVEQQRDVIEMRMHNQANERWHKLNGEHAGLEFALKILRGEV